MESPTHSISLSNKVLTDLWSVWIVRRTQNENEIKRLMRSCGPPAGGQAKVFFGAPTGSTFCKAVPLWGAYLMIWSLCSTGALQTCIKSNTSGGSLQNLTVMRLRRSQSRRGKTSSFIKPTPKNLMFCLTVKWPHGIVIIIILISQPCLHHILRFIFMLTWRDRTWRRKSGNGCW